MPETTRLAAQAAELAQAGLQVFPCGPDKAPLLAGGFHAASRNPRKLAAMPWRHAALIGAAIPEGQVVIDVDPRNGGEQTLRALRDAGHELPATKVIETAGGGSHHYYRLPAGVELRGRLGQGVDVKAAGRGYVIVPPSPGYRTRDDRPPAPLPDWLLDVLRLPERGDSIGEASEPKFLPFQDGTRYGLAALERIAGRLALARPGDRNTTLNSAAFQAGQLVAGGELDGEHAHALLEQVAELTGLDPHEIAATLRSGWQAGLAKPRQAPAPTGARPTNAGK